MTAENITRIDYVTRLAGVFKGGRISGWVERNRQALEEGNTGSIELTLLDKLSPGFAKETRDLAPEQKARAAKEALSLADQSPLSVTNLEPVFPGSAILVRKPRS